MKQILTLLASCAWSVLTCSLEGDTCNIGFETDSTGFKPDGFTSNDCAWVSFVGLADPVLGGAGRLLVDDFGLQSNGNGLAALGPLSGGGASALVINFAQPTAFVEFWFGNDDPGWSVPGDFAELECFDAGAVSVALTTVVLNRNDELDQAISISANTLPAVGSFVSCRFFYNVQRPGLAEVVDDITAVSADTFELACPCAGDPDWKNHGAYVKCIASVTGAAVEDGCLTGAQKDEIVSAAAESPCGSKK
jgi:hypothetical protein